MGDIRGFGDVTWNRINKSELDRKSNPSIVRRTESDGRISAEIFATDMEKEVFLCVVTDGDPDGVYMVNIKDIFRNGLSVSHSYVSSNRAKQNGHGQ